MNPANDYRNGTVYPAYTAAAYKRLFTLQDKYRVNLFFMLSWSLEFEDHDYFEGFRSLATNGFDKPVLNFFRKGGLMNGTRVTAESTGEVSLEEIVKTGVRDEPDVDAMATRGSNEGAVMLWNYHDRIQAGPAASAAVTVNGLPATVKRVLVLQYRIDDIHSNAYTVWKAMGSPQHPTTDQYAELPAKEGLELLGSPEWMDVVNGEIVVHVAMPRESISLLKLTW